MNKSDLIRPHIKGKSILDIGAVGNQLTKNNLNIKTFSKEYVGIDIQEAEGIIVADAQNFDLKRKFDIILALDIIEHLENAGLFLDCVKKHMKKGSKLIITTPNCLAITYMIEGRYYLNREHTCAYQEQTLKELLRRKGFDVKITHYHDTKGLIGKLLSLFIRGDKQRSLFCVAKLK